MVVVAEHEPVGGAPDRRLGEVPQRDGLFAVAEDLHEARLARALRRHRVEGGAEARSERRIGGAHADDVVLVEAHHVARVGEQHRDELPVGRGRLFVLVAPGFFFRLFVGLRHVFAVTVGHVDEPAGDLGAVLRAHDHMGSAHRVEERAEPEGALFVRRQPRERARHALRDARGESDAGHLGFAAAREHDEGLEGIVEVPGRYRERRAPLGLSFTLEVPDPGLVEAHALERKDRGVLGRAPHVRVFGASEQRGGGSERDQHERERGKPGPHEACRPFGVSSKAPWTTGSTRSSRRAASDEAILPYRTPSRGEGTFPAPLATRANGRRVRAGTTRGSPRRRPRSRRCPSGAKGAKFRRVFPSSRARGRRRHLRRRGAPCRRDRCLR